MNKKIQTIFRRFFVMPSTEGVIVKKVLPLIYVIDTSGSMFGDRIASVNEAIHELEPILREKVGEIPEAEIKIAALTFSSGARWITANGLVSLDDFFWNDATAGGLTDLGAALKELNQKLSRSSFLVSDTGFCAPVLIFMSDGEPNDNWEKELASIKQNNKWFQAARKIAIAIGEDANIEILTKLVGSNEAVIQTNDLETLKRMIIAVSVSASMLAGSSRMAGDAASGSMILEAATTTLDSDTYTVAPEIADFDGPDLMAAGDAGTQDVWDDSGDWN